MEFMFKTDEDIKIREASINDIKPVYQLQCFPSTRAYSRNVRIPSYDEHSEWMILRLGVSNVQPFYCIDYKNNKCVGVVRLDDAPFNCFEISIYLAPHFFGKGIAKQAIRLALLKNKGRKVIATVKRENLASVKLFLSLGFKKINDNTYEFKK